MVYIYELLPSLSENKCFENPLTPKIAAFYKTPLAKGAAAPLYNPMKPSTLKVSLKQYIIDPL